MVYQRTRSGERGPQLIFSDPDVTYSMANIVALNDGRAVIAFNKSVTSTCVAHYAIIPSLIVTTPTINPIIPGGATVSSCYGKPILATNGTTVYSVVDKVHDSKHVSYLYRKFLPSPASSEAMVVTSNLANVTDINSGLVTRVDALGNLHTAWLRDRRLYPADPDDTWGVDYANNTSTSGNLTAIPVAGSNSSFENIDIAVQSSTHARIVYVAPALPSYKLWLATIDSGVVTKSEIGLQTGLEWKYIAPAISNNGKIPGSVVIVFSAMNNTLDYSQIFYKTIPGGGYPTQLTNTNHLLRNNKNASVVTFDIGYLAGWRTYSSCPQNVFYSFTGDTPVTAFNTTGGCTSYGQTMQTGLSANGKWVAGAWIDRITSSPSARLVPWISFNTNKTLLPLVLR